MALRPALVAEDPNAGPRMRLSSTLVLLCPGDWLHGKAGTLAPLQEAMGEEEEEDYKVCIVTRGQTASFAPNAAVFPGGNQDLTDLKKALGLGPGEELPSGATGALDTPSKGLAARVRSPQLEAALKLTALREAYEEVGFCPLGAKRPSPPTSTGENRGNGAEEEELGKRGRGKRKEQGAEFIASLPVELVEQEKRALSFVYSFVIPDFLPGNGGPPQPPKVGVEVHFFLRELRGVEELNGMHADETEVYNLLWVSPAQALRLSEQGRLPLGPPQWYIMNMLHQSCPNLGELGRFLASDWVHLLQQITMKPLIAPSSRRLPGDDEEREEDLRVCILPGDDEHHLVRGPKGSRHRIQRRGGSKRRPMRCLGFERTVTSTTPWEIQGEPRRAAAL